MKQHQMNKKTGNLAVQFFNFVLCGNLGELSVIFLLAR